MENETWFRASVICAGVLTTVLAMWVIFSV